MRLLFFVRHYQVRVAAACLQGMVEVVLFLLSGLGSMLLTVSGVVC